HERALPGLELFSPSVDGGLRESGRRQVRAPRLLESDLQAVRNALDLLDDGVREGVRIRPQRRKLFLNPGDAFGRRVFPQDLVVLGEGALRLVDRSKKARLRTISGFDDASLPVDEDTVLRNYPDLDMPARQ